MTGTISPVGSATATPRFTSGTCSMESPHTRVDLRKLAQGLGRREEHEVFKDALKALLAARICSRRECHLDGDVVVRRGELLSHKRAR
jgi:hypothetical protein